MCQRTMLRRALQRSLLSVALVVSVATAYGAEECAQDLSALESSITNAPLRQSLSVPIDQHISELGGLEAAFAITQTTIETTQHMLADGSLDALAAEQADPAAFKTLAEESLRVAQALLSAIQCRMAAGD